MPYNLKRLHRRRAAGAFDAHSPADVKHAACAATARSNAYDQGNTMSRTVVSLLCLFAAALTAPEAAVAQSYATRPVTLVVPYGPGGGADIVARTVSQHLSSALQQQIVIENRPGAGGSVGAAYAAKARPDGYTLMLGTNTHALNVSLRKNLPYDFADDFEPVGQLSAFPYVFVVHPSLPVASVEALVALARKHPGELDHSSSGNGSTPHLTAEMFKSVTGIKMVHVPYKGAATALNDLIAGRVQLGFASISSALPQVKNRRLRALAVTGAKRSATMPELPTMIEAGYAQIVVNTWNAVFAPAGTPPEIIRTLDGHIATIVNNPAVRQRFAAVGVDPVSRTSEQLGAYVIEEITRWGKVVKASGAVVD